jgi:superfamily I DNA/RNA helicase
MPRQIVVIGPPGTGKTESVVRRSRDWFFRGAGPDEVAYLAFTRAAAHVAAERILDQEVTEIVGEKLPFFRTIHSMAYRGMRGEFPDIRPLMTADMKRFSQWSGFEGSYAVQNSEDLSEAYQHLENRGRTDWDKCLTAYTLSRISARSTADLEAARTRMSRTAQRIIGFLEEEAYRVFIKKYEIYKADNGLVDFTDMLAFALSTMRPLQGVRYVVVDESQDLGPLLHGVIDRCFSNAQEIWWAGDEDQTIFSFAAADARLFMERIRTAYARIFLRQTRRFGQDIVEFSSRIIRRVRDRVEKDVVGVAGRTHVIRSTGSFKPVAGRRFILHRHVMGCQDLAQSYIAAGLPFRNERGKDPLGYAIRVKAFRAMHEISEGRPVSLGGVSRMVDELIPSVLVSEDGTTRTRLVIHGGKKRLQDAAGLPEKLKLQDMVDSKILTKAGADIVKMRQYRLIKYADDLEYYDRVIANGHRLDEAGPVITTIHGSKGREAPSVIVFNEMGRRCWDDSDTEHRLAYVAATRTYGDLEICGDRTLDWTDRSYDYPLEKPCRV